MVPAMELETDKIIPWMERWTNRFTDIIAASSPAELALCVALPILALLIGIRLNRYIDSRPKSTLYTKLIDFVGPLIAPFFAALFTITTALILREIGHEPHILGFVTKICIAWFAVELVMIVSSGRTAGMFIAFIILPITLLHLFEVWDPTIAFLESSNFTIGSLKLNLLSILQSVVAIIALLWAVNFVLNITENRLRRMRNLRASNRTLIMKFSQIVLYIIAFLVAMNMVGVSLTTLSIFSGALGVGIGFGLQKIASNFISGIILLFEKSVEVDDLVQLDDGTLGFIRRTGARYTLVESFDKRFIYVPNEDFIIKPVINLIHADRTGRADVKVGVAYGTDMRLALKLCEQAAAMSDHALKDPAPSANVVGFGDSAVNILLTFWVADVGAGRVGPSSDVMINMLELFEKHGISIPFPHQVQIADPAFEERFAALESKLATLSKKTPTKPASKKSGA